MAAQNILLAASPCDETGTSYFKGLDKYHSARCPFHHVTARGGHTQVALVFSIDWTPARPCLQQGNKTVLGGP